MAGRPSNRASQQAPAASGAARQNEYFVPRDGIDREVITSDICRYLGNDALVRPGTYESPDGRVTQGYYITAYRNLTSAMIQDLKADSARWEQERRAAARSQGGGAGGSRDHRGQDYNAWKNSQREAQYEAQYSGSAMDVDYAPPGPAATPVYAGQPYAGAPPANYPPATYPPQVHAAPAQYQAQPGYPYPPNPPPTQYSPPPPTSGDRYSGIHPPPVAGTYGQDAFVHGSNYQATGNYPPAGPNRMAPPVPHGSAPPSRTFNAPSAGTPVYGTEADRFGFSSPPVGAHANTQHPIDPGYGRGAYATTTATPREASSDVLGSPAGPTQRQGYAAPPDPQYDAHQNPPLQAATTPTTAAPTPSPLPTGGAGPARRDHQRDSEPRDQHNRNDRGDYRRRTDERDRSRR
ncbi:hypothetical protein P885DRAFT_76396 [Corynascus similis CBS 632.67]